MRSSKAQISSEVITSDAVYLRRQLGLLPAMSITIGTVVGSAIFIAPKGILSNAGSVGLALVVWVLSGMVSLLGALCLTELGTTFSKSGGSYLFVLETLGPLPAFLRVWLEFLFIRPASSSFLALAFGNYLMEPFFFPCPPPMLLIKIVGILAVTFVTTINCWSVKLAYQTQEVLTFTKVLAMVIIIIPGIYALLSGKTENFRDSFEIDDTKVHQWPLAFLTGLYAYGGWVYLSFVTEEVVNPTRNVPLAIISSMVIVMVLYLLINLSYFAVLTPEEILLSDAVAAKFADRALHKVSDAVPFIVASSCLGVLNGSLFGSPRLLFAGAREGHWPLVFSMIHIRRRTPLPAVLLLYPLAITLVITGEVDQLLIFSTFSRWIFLTLTIMGMIIHRCRFPLLLRPFKLPMAILVLFFFICFFIVIISMYSDPQNAGVSFFLFMTGVPVYYLTIDRYRLPRRWKQISNYWSTKLQILLEVVKQEVQTY